MKLKANQTDPRKSPKIVSITSRAFLNLKLLLRSIPTLIRLQLALLISAYFLHWLLQSVAEFSSLLPLMAVFINPKLRVESLETRDMMSQTPIGEPILPMDATKSIDALFADQNVVFNPAANAAPSNDALDEYFQELAGEPFVKKDGIDFNFEPELGEYSGLAINSGTDELFITDSDANAVIRATAEGLLLSKIDVSGLKNPAAP